MKCQHFHCGGIDYGRDIVPHTMALIARYSQQDFVDGVMQRMIFDGEQLSDLLVSHGLGWKDRTKKELALMEELIPLLHKLAHGREIAGLGAYET